MQLRDLLSKYHHKTVATIVISCDLYASSSAVAISEIRRDISLQAQVARQSGGARAESAPPPDRIAHLGLRCVSLIAYIKCYRCVFRSIVSAC